MTQTPSERSLELQLYDFPEFPNIDADGYNVGIKKFVSGEIMKSGKPRAKNAISFNMDCNPSQDFHECINYFVFNFIENKIDIDFVKSLGCAQAFVRFRLPKQSDEEVEDFSISGEVMKVLLDRNIHLDFWFLH